MTIEDDFGIPPIKKEDIQGLSNKEITDYIQNRMETYLLQTREAAEYRQRTMGTLSWEQSQKRFTY